MQLVLEMFGVFRICAIGMVAVNNAFVYCIAKAAIKHSEINT